jgi:hypothetical protein
MQARRARPEIEQGYQQHQEAASRGAEAAPAPPVTTHTIGLGTRGSGHRSSKPQPHLRREESKEGKRPRAGPWCHEQRPKHLPRVLAITT